MQRIRRVTGNVPALVDSTGVGDPIVEGLQRFGQGQFTGYQFTFQSKQKLMEGLAVDIQSRKVGFPEGPIVTELEQFEYEIRPTGVRYKAADGAYDDCVCALALARQQQRSVPVGVVGYGSFGGLA